MATKPSPRHLGVLGVSAVLTYLLDQLAKQWALTNLRPGEPQQVVGSLLQLNLTFNPGAAFSFATNATWLLTVIAVVVVVVVLFAARKLRNVMWAAAFGLLVGGALGNLTDRFAQPPGGGNGHVVDYLQLPHWPIFNVADMAICTAAALIVVQSFRGVGLDGSRDTENADGADDEDTRESSNYESNDYEFSDRERGSHEAQDETHRTHDPVHAGDAADDDAMKETK